MRREYTRPIMICEVFSADEYVAACGESGTTYFFKCDAGKRYKNYTVYEESNGIPGLQKNFYKGDKLRTRTYSPCGKTHEADSTDVFLNGYLDTWPNATPVVIWTGKRDDNTHCTTELNQENWETTKS